MLGIFSFDDGQAQVGPIAPEYYSKPNRLEAEFLLQWYLCNPGSVYYLFEEHSLQTSLLEWLLDFQQQYDWTSSKLYLVLALGAQNCPEDMDVLAEQYYEHGRSLTLLRTNENLNTSIEAAQCYTLMAIYLLGSSRIEAAFMQLGQAIRAANALGLHQVDIAINMTSSECSARENLWKVIRVLDCFLSVLLGRPMATCESRNTTETSDYSTTIDMCMIFETLVTELYTNPLFYDYALQSIMEQNRQWTVRFPTGLTTDRIQSSETIGCGDQVLPNLGLIHIKHAFHSAIILSTQRSLVQHILKNLSSSTSISIPSQDQGEVYQTPLPLSGLQVACVQSAANLVNLFTVLLKADPPPKRLPFVISPLFYAGLVVGFAILGGYYHELHLEDILPTTRKLLSLFSRHDRLAMRYLKILETLEVACQIYVNKTTQTRLKMQKALVHDLFGRLDQYKETSLELTDTSSNLARHNEEPPLNQETYSQDSPINTNLLDPWKDLDTDAAATGMSSSSENFYDESLNYMLSPFVSFSPNR